MLIDDTEEYGLVWDRVYDELGFKPSYYDNDHSMNGTLPFDIAQHYAVYSTDEICYDRLDEFNEAVTAVFADITPSDKKVYALDWQHSAFKFDPRNRSEMQDIQAGCQGFSEGYTAYFPTFYPNGDYYLFIAEEFSFGWLGHPWRQEVWLFGDELIERFDKLYKNFNMKKITEQNGG